MALQNSVGFMPSAGLPGQEVNAHTAVYTPLNFMSDGTCVAGKFAFAAVAPEGDGVHFDYAALTGEALLGFVERTFGSMLDVKVEASDVYVKGTGLNIAVRGDYYISAPAVCQAGQHVLVDKATGDLSFGDGTSLAEGVIDTGWIVYRGCEHADELAVITRR